MQANEKLWRHILNTETAYKTLHVDDKPGQRLAYKKTSHLVGVWSRNVDQIMKLDPIVGKNLILDVYSSSPEAVLGHSSLREHPTHHALYCVAKDKAKLYNLIQPK